MNICHAILWLFVILDVLLAGAQKAQDGNLSDIRIKAVIEDSFNGHIHSELLNITCGRFVQASFLIDYESGKSIVVRRISSSGIETGSISIPTPIKSGDTLEFKVSIKDDSEKCEVFCGDSSCVFSALPLPFPNSDLIALRGFACGRLLSFSIPQLPKKSSYPIVPILIIAVLLADIVLVATLVHRSAKQRKNTVASENVSSKLITDLSPEHKSILLFGDFKVISYSGEDITHRFSPIIKDLLILLLYNTPKGGITSDKLESILWIDKAGKRATNNRSVSVSKLRSMLKEVGECRIVNNGTYWTLETSDIYIDFYAFIKLLKNGEINNENIETLLNMLNRGMFLNDSASIWSDEFKYEVSDLVITVLIKYASGINVERNCDTIIRICDAINNFDSLDETSLELKCKAYQAKGNFKLAHRIFNNFTREYKELYGQTYSKSYTDIVGK